MRRTPPHASNACHAVTSFQLPGTGSTAGTEENREYSDNIGIGTGTGSTTKQEKSTKKSAYTRVTAKKQEVTVMDI